MVNNYRYLLLINQINSATNFVSSYRKILNVLMRLETYE